MDKSLYNYVLLDNNVRLLKNLTLFRDKVDNDSFSIITDFVTSISKDENLQILKQITLVNKMNDKLTISDFPSFFEERFERIEFYRNCDKCGLMYHNNRDLWYNICIYCDC